jgi:perosamine synthetase
MSWKIPLFKIYTDDDDIQAVNEVIKSGLNWAMGPKIEQFEKELADFVGTKYALSFNSGTSALHALMKAYGFGPGDEIIVPAVTFIATCNAPLFVGAKPVFSEIEDKTFGLDPKDIENKITKNTKAIMPIHYGGCACMIEEIKKIAEKHKLILIEDAAESLGATVNNKKVGTFGDSAIFSFCGPKVITTGEGGAIVTNSQDLYEKLKLIRSHGRLESANYFNTADYMDYVTLGYNFRISNILAALGISQLKKIGKVVKMRNQNSDYLTKKLSEVKEIITPVVPDGFSHLFQMYTIKINGGKNVRDALQKVLNDKGIMAKVYYYPVHLSSFYKKTFGYKKGDLPQTEKISDEVLTLPMYPELTTEEMDYMAQEIKSFFQKNGDK